MNYLDKYKIMKEFDYSKPSKFLKTKSFLDPTNYILYFVKKCKNLFLEKINFYYGDLDDILLHTITDDITPAVFINTKLAEKLHYDKVYLAKFGLYAIVMNIDLCILHDFNKMDIDNKIFFKLDELAKNIFIEIEELELPKYTTNDLALFLYKNGRKFVCIVFNAIYDNKISMEYASKIFDIEQDILRNFYDDYITMAYIHRTENGNNI